MEKKYTNQQIIELITTLKTHYPMAKCSLNFNTPFQLAIAVMLSAQCTDERVNKTTPALFTKYPTLQDFANANITELEQLIRPCGLYKNKSKNIIGLAKAVLEKYNGILPDNIEDLMKLPGIGRKSANVIMTDAYNNPQGIAVDTHVKRVSNRLHLSKESTPDKIEQDLLKIIPTEYLKLINHLFMWHGRYTCKAPTPQCNLCPVKKFCQEQQLHDYDI